MMKKAKKRSKVTSIEFFDHTADAGIIVTAPTLARLLEEAARGMNQILIDPRTVGKIREIKINATGSSPADLMINWLRELLYIHSEQHLVYCDFHVEETEPEADTLSHISGIALGEPYDGERHHLFTEIKLITYHKLEARKGGDTWFGRVIFDL